MVNETAFSFEISEILYLHETHALEEMIELSLEPNVNLTKQNEEVNLKGSLRLLGKYIKSNEELTLDPMEVNLNDSRKLLEEVNELADHSEFTHDFPVNIFVPAYRLKDGAKTDVSIAAFDYEVINPVTLRFIATVEISGFLPEEKVREVDGEKVEEIETPVESLPQEEILVEESRQEIIQDTSQETDSKNEEIKPEPEKIKKPEKKKQVRKDKNKESTATVEQSDKEPSEEINETESDRNDLNYLTNMFDNNEGKQAKLQICIVQEQDTLDSISERFSIKKSQLMKQNNLDDETIQSGEILFISFH